MRVDDFDFDLPQDLIALRPVAPRDAARLLVVREDGSREHRTIRDLPALLRSGDTLVVKLNRVRLTRDTAVSGDQIVPTALGPRYYRDLKFDEK